MSNGEAIQFYRSLVEFVRWLEDNGDPTLPYSSAKQFAKYVQVASRTQVGKLNRFFGKYLEADHLIEKRFQAYLPSANLDALEWEAKLVPKNNKVAKELNKYRTKPFPYTHSVKTYQLRRLIPHGLEGHFTVQEIWDAHAWTFKKLGIEGELEQLKRYFRNAGVRFRIPKRDPLSRKVWKEKASHSLKTEKTPRTSKRPLSSHRERRIQRNLERARQRQGRERARARKAADPRGVSDKGTANKYGADTRPAPSTGRRIAARAGKIAGRVLKKGVSLSLTILDAKARAEKTVAHLRQDIFDRKQEANAEIEQLKQLELESEANLQRFEATPFDQFWFRVSVTLEMRVTYTGNQPVFRYTDITVKSVRIVDAPGKAKVFGDPVAKGNRTYEQEYIEYLPVFEELTRGQKLAADGYPLSVVDRSHGGPAGEQRLQIIYDYIVFAKEYPQLAKQYQDAWRRYRDELCMAGFRDLFTEFEIEVCRHQQHAEELRKARGTSRRLNLIEGLKQRNVEEATNKYLQRIAPSQGE